MVRKSRVGHSNKTMAKKYCKCIGAVRRKMRGTMKARESAAIGICTKSILQTRGRTLRKFTCGSRPKLLTQKMKRT